MADDAKKVSFGFAKSIKKSALKIVPPQIEKKVDYIECLDGKSIKVVGGEEKADGPLVIPLLGSKTWHDRILNKTDADIFESKTGYKENGITVKIENGNAGGKNDGTLVADGFKIKKEKSDPTDGLPKTLEEQAASEIIEDLCNKNIKVEDPNLEVPVTENETLHGEQESTLEDYEQIPIDAFGLAMLRGMGWKPGKGIGKNEKLVAAALPELRPRGMGLGADKVTLQKQNAQPKTREEEQLKVEKGAFVKVIAGKEIHNYGQIEAFDDDAGRLIVKMAITGENKSLNECIVQPVTKAEYSKNSKVLNATKYEEYKNKRAYNEPGETGVVTLDTDTSNDDDTKKRREGREKFSKIKKKSKKRSKYTSDESEDSDRRTKKRRDSSDSEGRHKRTKKSKKSHKRDSSTERSSKKNKKRDKERERKSEYAESSDRRKHKKHKRSRSRSPARR